MNASRKIRAVFLDAGGTLFRPYPSVGHLYARAARRHGCRVSPAWVQGRFRREWNRRRGLASLTHATEARERAWWGGLVRAVFGRRLPADRFDRFFEELYALFARPSSWRLFPDVLPALRRMKRRGLRLGVVSNWDSRLFPLCDGLGVSRYVDFILASAVEGSAKPDAGIFRKALRRARVRPGEALHVGDGYWEDYMGARRAGLKGLWLRRNGGTANQSAGRVTRLTEVAALF